MNIKRFSGNRNRTSMGKHSAGSRVSPREVFRNWKNIPSHGVGRRSVRDIKRGRHANGAVFGRWIHLFEAVRDYLISVNWVLLAAAVICSVYGCFVIASTKNGSVLVQVAAIILGVAAYFVIAMFDLSHLAVFWKILVAAGVGILLSVLVLGRSAGGNNGWISLTIGGADFGFQPGEVIKICMIITLAKHMDILGEKIRNWRGVLQITAHFGLYAVALLFSKDDGMLLTYGILFVILVFAGGIPLRYLLLGGTALVGALPLLWNYVLDEYQKMRVLVVLDPTLDTGDKGYQAYISKIAIRNGGLTGMGYGCGRVTQESLPGNLPAKHTDFIFSVICEEMGWIGGIFAVGLLCLVILFCFVVAARVRHDKFSYLLTIGVASMLTFQTFLNVGMCMGVVPVIGLTLPFFSYGGSSILTMFVSIGVVASAGAHIRPRTLSDETTG